MGATGQSEDRAMLGIGLRLLAVFLLSSLYAMIKVAEGWHANLVEIMFFRQAFSIPVTIAYMIVAGPGLAAVRSGAPRGQVIRAIIGLISMAFNFGATLLLPLAEATTLAFTVPIFATILGALMLREPTGWRRWTAVMTGFGGVLIITQPGSGHFPLWGAICGLMSSISIALVAIQLRQIGKVDLPVTTVFWFSSLSMLPLGALYPFFAQAHDAATFALLAAMGLVGGLGQIAFSAALRHAPVSTVMPMDYSAMLWAMLYGLVLFGALPTPWTWIGTPVIVASGLYIVWRERKVARNPQVMEAIAD
ncbi:DMT family transporter [Sphingomonas immobilis]|uniref:DMT family transporter n=1 Tax=Sphingomonas immobilis TaxID=3063997 RepID=A0ABT8ZYR3_9SPHN|nr:DMT family transporter [Sphingomonas sp. CA1-15]MDO7842418.1 DMT family transporter [Sphingomonas sp. CA1-15]